MHIANVARRVLGNYKPHEGDWPTECYPAKREVAGQKMQPILDARPDPAKSAEAYKPLRRESPPMKGSADDHGSRGGPRAECFRHTSSCWVLPGGASALAFPHAGRRAHFDRADVRLFRGEGAPVPELGLSDSERERLRDAARYVIALTDELRKRPEKKSKWAVAIEFLSQGFVVLIVGTVLTSILVPIFQRRYEERQQRLQSTNECLKQFLLASNLIYQEFFVVSPLQHRAELDPVAYSAILVKLAEVKVKRYDAFANVQALAAVFEADPKLAPLREEIRQHVIRVNAISNRIDDWVRQLYCSSVGCANYPDVAPLAWYREYTAIQHDLRDIQVAEQSVSSQIVKVLTE